MAAPKDAAALIMAGGRGTRLWPLSRAGRPKPLFALDGQTTLLGATIARLASLVPRERIFVIAAAGQASAFRRALRGLTPPRNLLIEPEGRGTAMAIAYGAALIEQRVGPGLIAVLPADHFVTPPAGFRRTLKRAFALARAHDAIVVVGVTPTRPEPGYGYQKIGPAVDGGFRVEHFVEKPAAAQAARMVRSGRFLWNAGMFVMSTGTLVSELETHCAPLARLLPALGALSGRKLARAYRRLTLDSFDREIIEKSQRVMGVRADFRWHDVGSWQGLWEAMRGRDGNVLSGPLLAIDSHGVVARGHRNRLTVLMGVDDLVVIDDDDALLVARRTRSQELRRVIDEIGRRGFARYL